MCTTRLATVRSILGVAPILALGTAACDNDPVAVREPARIDIISEVHQLTNAGEWVGFEVSVSYADGSPAPHVTVDWSVSSGSGLFWAWDDWEPELSTTVSAETGAEGLSIQGFMPTHLGASTVRARAASIYGTEIGAVEFTVTTDALTIVVGPDIAWVEQWPYGPDRARVPAGTPIDWVSEGAAQLRSRSVPPGGAAFDSGVLAPGDRFRFVPNVPGTWTWEYEDQATTAVLTLTVD